MKSVHSQGVIMIIFLVFCTLPRDVPCASLMMSLDEGTSRCQRRLALRNRSTSK